MKPEVNISRISEIKRKIGLLCGGDYGVFYDGAFDLESYNHAETRILWILKEAVGDCEAEEYNMALINDNVKRGCFGPTLRVISFVSDGILRCRRTWSDVPPLYNGASDALREIAIINVKKAMGRTRSVFRDIVRAYLQNKSLIEEQIEAYDPDVVIMGFPEDCEKIVDGIVGADGPLPEMKHIGDCAYIQARGRRYVWHYHPSKPGNGKRYFEEILAGVRAPA